MIKGVKVVDGKEFKDVKNILIKDVKVVDLKEVKDVKDIENVKDVKNVKDVISVKDIKNVKDVKEVKNINDVMKIKEVKNINNVMKIKEVKDINNDKDVKNINEVKFKVVKEFKIDGVKVKEVKPKDDIIVESVAAEQRCPHCWYETGVAWQMERHLRDVHPKVKTHKCPMPNCGYSTTKKDRMASHVVVSVIENCFIFTTVVCGSSDTLGEWLKCR